MTAAQGIPDRLVVSAEERLPALLDVIRQARTRITLSLFRCNDQAVFDALKAASDRGVAVEVLVTSRAKGGKKKMAKLWRALEQTGASLHSYTDPVVKYHPKYLVADEGPAIVASLNLTRKCFRKTLDALVVTYDPAVVTGLRQLWTADRGRLEMPADISDRLIVGPERARRQFTALIEGARTSIRLIDAKLSDPDLVSLLNAKRAAGMTVERFSGKQLGDLKSHGKIMLIDDQTVVVGSLALAALSLDFRREVAIVVTEPPAVAVAVELFQAVRDAATEGRPATAGPADEALW
jgi:cardiolipin synthase